MGLLVVGSVALDSVKTPFGQVSDVLGGSATYFSASASFFTDVGLVAVVGNDFPDKYIRLLDRMGVDLAGLQVKEGKTFRWNGKYDYDLNKRTTVYTHLNVFSEFNPVLPDGYRDIKYVFLANIDPVLQYNVLRQIKNPRLVACDSMNFWIQNKKRELVKLLKYVDVFIINDSEARQFSDEPNLLKAANHIASKGPEIVIIKKGEHGALLFVDGVPFSAPAYPLESIYDPTGAGDTFAGGFMGYLARKKGRVGERDIRRAVIYGSVMASFVVENFSLERLKTLNMEKVEARYGEFKKLVHF
jgi:sugar/nucleoside kinase (ribokinase family)